MAKQSPFGGTTSFKTMLFAQDATTGLAKTGLVYTGVTCYYKRNTGSAAVAVTLATITTLGTYAAGGFKEIHATYMAGLYEFHPPDAAIAAGADSVVFEFAASGVNFAPLEFRLTGTDDQDATRAGMAALPAGPMRFKKNQAFGSYTFVMRDGSMQPVDSLTIVAKRSIDGGAYASCSNSATFISNGTYKIDLSAGDLNGDNIMLFFSGGVGALPYFEKIVTQP